MFEPGDRLLDGGPVPGRDPPHDEIGPVQVLEPFGPPAVETLVHGLPDIFFQCFDALPDRHVHGHARIGERPNVRCVAGLVLEPPNETLAALGYGIDARQVVEEIREARIVELIAQPPDIQLCEVFGGVGHVSPYSAAIAAGSG